MEGRSNGKTLNLFLLSRRFHKHRIRLPEQAFSAEREPWKLK